jgi:DNA-binding XRE family transcriptional regulator
MTSAGDPLAGAWRALRSRLALVRALLGPDTDSLVIARRVLLARIRFARATQAPELGAVEGSAHGRSEGRRLLLRALQTTTQAEVGHRVGVSQYAVSRWASGHSTPQSYVLRLAIYRELRIEPSSWDRVVGLNSTV